MNNSNEIKLEKAVQELKISMSEQNLITQNALSTLLQYVEKCMTLDKNGLFAESPCNIGDTIYYVEWYSYYDDGYFRVKEDKVLEIEFGRNDIYFKHSCNGCFKLSDIGEKVFLNKEDAEKKAKELKNLKKEREALERNRNEILNKMNHYCKFY